MPLQRPRNGHTSEVDDSLAEVGQPAVPVSVGPPPDDPDAVEWRLTMPGGEQHGPTVPTIFAQWIVSGRVPPDALVWRSGWTEWRTASNAVDEMPAPLPVGFSAGDAPPPETPPKPPTRPGKSAGVGKEPHLRSLGEKRGYTAKRRALARRRRMITVVLAVVCVLLTAMLVLLSTSGPPVVAPASPP